VQNKWIFTVAFLAVLFGIIGLFSRLTVPANAQGNTVTLKTTEQIKMVNVWRARSPIPAGQLLSSTLFKQDSLSLVDANDLGLMQGKLTISDDAISRANLMVDDLLQAAHIVTPNTADYIDLLLAPGMTPYPIAVDPFAVYGGQIKVGDYVDVITLMSKSANIASNKRIGLDEITVSPLLIARRVLAISAQEPAEAVIKTQKSNDKTVQQRLIIELTRQEVAQMAIAKRIGIIEIYKSVNATIAEQTRANSKDVLPRSNTITEFRGNAPAAQ